MENKLIIFSLLICLFLIKEFIVDLVFLIHLFLNLHLRYMYIDDKDSSTGFWNKEQRKTHTTKSWWVSVSVTVTCAVPGQITSNAQNSKERSGVCQSQKKLRSKIAPRCCGKHLCSCTDGAAKKSSQFRTPLGECSWLATRHGDCLPTALRLCSRGSSGGLIEA